ncbi:MULTISPECIES: IS91 family transposase [unclassified Oceanispirochaeta]|uniref:IS91 family transposase n=1 Tax=unclassified Oceanispirochaeta TaxID=2635722 RepID=UPI000E09A0DB|nr:MULTISPECIES: IS91 family transposase [unclassified Oceanispirochaeta]MBF9016396.1 IS91 family transposase [Oceanispirochaeta sp. M2]NPD72858.1 IS91 family transposase [Oceanispirochaeta sp. M1]RDG31702.1 IS91 family transposase [Oceanispirochaeta sp. M1]
MSNLSGKRSSVEIADIFRIHAHKLPSLSWEQEKVINDIIGCRTAILGGHIRKCDECGNPEISYNSCRNRHCPKCQSFKKELWIADREQELLPVSYFHIVFTIPRILAPIALQNKEKVYGMLFKAVSQTLKEVAAKPKNLDAQIGLIAVLHTWDQKLGHHPHIHCIVPGGGISKDKTKWIKSGHNFFLSVNILSSVFRGKFLNFLENAFNKKELSFFGDYSHISGQLQFRQLLIDSCKTNWVVYAKKSFAGPKLVIKYLGRYTHRIAISNYRIKSMTDTHVSFTWRDRKHDNELKTMELDVVSFMRRYLLHILPSGFMKMRYYGFLGNVTKKKSLKLCRELLGVPMEENKLVDESSMEIFIRITGSDPTVCPICGKGHMVLLQEIPMRKVPPLLKTG